MYAAFPTTVVLLPWRDIGDGGGFPWWRRPEVKKEVAAVRRGRHKGGAAECSKVRVTGSPGLYTRLLYNFLP